MKMRAVGSFLLITAFSLAAGATAIPLGSSGSSHFDALNFENLSLDGQMIATQISASGGIFNSDLPSSGGLKRFDPLTFDGVPSNPLEREGAGSLDSPQFVAQQSSFALVFLGLAGLGFGGSRRQSVSRIV